MRLVAITLPLLFILAAMPAAVADDECRSPCVAVSTSGVPNAPVKTYYLYGNWLSCPASNNCRGSPPAFFAGTVWEETNSVGGLQRSTTVMPSGQIIRPDAVVAV